MYAILKQSARASSLRTKVGLLRSLIIYYGNPHTLWRMRRFYAQFISPDDLCFDVGAHVGNRLWVWSQLGARVVGVEPQPSCLAFLRRWYGAHPRIQIVGEAVGATIGAQTLWLSEDNPTVTTLSQPWIESVQQVDSFAWVRWQASTQVDVTTLDTLIARFGEPAFCKIDIEGYELDALRGLSHPLRALSFEFLPVSKALAIDCVSLLMKLGDYEFNWSLGEQHRWQSPYWVDEQAMVSFLQWRAPNDHSGDIYARRKG